MDFTEDEIEKYEQKLDSTDVKAVLIDIASTNRQILNQLYLLNQTLDEPQSESEMYECDMCSEKIPKDKRKRHAEADHNAPDSILLEELYTEI